MTSDDERTAEDWLRAMFEGAPYAVRLFLRIGWTLLTLRRPGGVLGWQVTVDDPGHARMYSTSPIGLGTELKLVCNGPFVRFTTSITFDTHLSRLLWRPVAPIHRLTVRWLLGRVA